MLLCVCERIQRAIDRLVERNRMRHYYHLRKHDLLRVGASPGIRFHSTSRRGRAVGHSLRPLGCESAGEDSPDSRGSCLGLVVADVGIAPGHACPGVPQEPSDDR